MGGVWSMFEVSNWEEARCPDRSNRSPSAFKNNAATAATAAVPKNTASNNAIIKNVKNTNTKNTNAKNTKNANNAKNTNLSHAAAARRAANTTAGV